MPGRSLDVTFWRKSSADAKIEVFYNPENFMKKCPVT